MSVYVRQQGNIFTIDRYPTTARYFAEWNCETLKEAENWKKELVRLYAPKWLAQGIRMWHILKDIVSVNAPYITDFYLAKSKYGKGLTSHCALCHIHRMLYDFGTAKCNCPLVDCTSRTSAYFKAFYAYKVDERREACDIIIKAHYEMARRLGVDVSE